MFPPTKSYNKGHLSFDSYQKVMNLDIICEVFNFSNSVVKENLMSILSLTSLQFANSLYSNMSPKSSANNGLVKIMDSIVDQYMTSAISNEMIMKDLSGFYTRQGTSLQSSLGFPQNPATHDLISASLKSKQQPVFSIDSVTDGTNNYKLLRAINRSIIGTDINFFSKQFTSTGGLFDILV